MNKPVQARTLKTRVKLIDAAVAVVAEVGYEGLRVEEVVARAGVAKGTFFAHFRDKDALMDHLIGAELDRLLDELEAGPRPGTADEMAEALGPLIDFASSERYVFDVILRYSGAAAIEDVGPIARTFERQYHVFSSWLDPHDNVPTDLLADGIQAFLMQALSVSFCALHNSTAAEVRLKTYPRAWLR